MKNGKRNFGFQYHNLGRIGINYRRQKMKSRVVNVKAIWDKDAQVWVAISEVDLTNFNSCGACQ